MVSFVKYLKKMLLITINVNNMISREMSVFVKPQDLKVVRSIAAYVQVMNNIRA